MSTEDAVDAIEDVRFTTLVHRAMTMSTENRMTPMERLAVGAHLMASVIRSAPDSEQTKWLARAIHEVCTQSAALGTIPPSRDLAALSPPIRQR